MEFGHRILHAIDQIYSSQFIRILINNQLTDLIAVKKGTRQGCTLSPLLFIISLEVLLNQIRNHPNITELKTNTVQAFADDLLIILEDLKMLLLVFVNSYYGTKFGFKINHNKTYIIMKNTTSTQALKLLEISSFPSHLKFITLWYIWLNDAVHDNHVELLNQIKEDLRIWETFQLSHLGRIATIKMSVLPKISISEHAYYNVFYPGR